MNTHGEELVGKVSQEKGRRGADPDEVPRGPESRGQACFTRRQQLKNA